MGSRCVSRMKRGPKWPSIDAFHTAIVGASLLALAPALLGMLLGQWIRERISAEAFRRFFFVGLLLLGAHLVLRTVL